MLLKLMFIVIIVNLLQIANGETNGEKLTQNSTKVIANITETTNQSEKLQRSDKQKSPIRKVTSTANDKISTSANSNTTIDVKEMPKIPEVSTAKKVQMLAENVMLSDVLNKLPKDHLNVTTQAPSTNSNNTIVNSNTDVINKNDTNVNNTQAINIHSTNIIATNINTTNFNQIVNKVTEKQTTLTNSTNATEKLITKVTNVTATASSSPPPPPPLLPQLPPKQNNANISNTNATNKSTEKLPLKHKKPLVTFSVDDIINLNTKYSEGDASKQSFGKVTNPETEPMLENPEVQPSQEQQSYFRTSNGADYIVPIVTIIFTVPLAVVVIILSYRRFRDLWSTRHYRRMDFLVDGMYND